MRLPPFSPLPERSGVSRAKPQTELQNLLKDHIRYLIEEAWPQQRRGIVPVEEVDRVAVLQARLAVFEPQTKAQELLHENTLRQFNTFYEHRRARIYSLTAGIPAILWYTVAVGAVINMILLWQFDIRPHAHLDSPPEGCLPVFLTITDLHLEPYRAMTTSLNTMMMDTPCFRRVLARGIRMRSLKRLAIPHA